MRRLLTVVLALAVVASLSFAATNEVTSVNAVGYVTVTVPADSFEMLAINFNAIDPMDQTLEALMGGSMRADPEGDPEGTDQVWIWGGLGYSRYFRYSGDGLIYNIDLEQPENPTVGPFDGVWFKTPGSGPYAPDAHDVTIAGEVVTTADPLPVVMGFQAVGYPYSSGVAAWDTALTTLGTSSAEDPEAADQIWMWSPTTGYTRLALWDDGSQVGWLDIDLESYAYPDIDIGKGFWYISKAPFSWGEACPYTL